MQAPQGAPPPQGPGTRATTGPPSPLRERAGMARALLGASGIGIAAWAFVVLAGHGFAPTPLFLAAFTMRMLLALAFLAAALAPEGVARLARAPALATPGGLGAFALMAVALYFVFGLGTVVETAGLLERVAAGETPEQLVADLDQATLLTSLFSNLAVFTVPVLAWVALAEGRHGPRLWAWLGLKRAGLGWSVAWCTISVLLVFWALIAAGLATRALGQPEFENERAEAIARQLTIPLALLVAAVTGIGEEVFFRGFLLRKLGNVPQAILFGLAHANYLQVLEVTVTAALGYMFGRAVLKTGNLWGAVFGHAAFNAVSLLIVILREGGALG